MQAFLISLQIENYALGSVVDVDVDHYDIATAEEIAERGLEEV